MPNKIAEKIRGVFFKLLMEFPVERLRDFDDQRSSLVLPFQLETVIKSSDLKKNHVTKGILKMVHIVSRKLLEADYLTRRKD
jgi:hypothetical protein